VVVGSAGCVRERRELKQDRLTRSWRAQTTTTTSDNNFRFPTPELECSVLFGVIFMNSYQCIIC
jgi:hypothetical protein